MNLKRTREDVDNLEEFAETERLMRMKQEAEFERLYSLKMTAADYTIVGLLIAVVIAWVAL